MTATDYSTYLRIDALLTLQEPLTPGADDEMLFIIVHQAYELWFKLLIHELGLARDALYATQPWKAVPRLARAVAIDELLYKQLTVLETLTPEGFLEFRDPLTPASGFQSTQFREIERLSGGDLWDSFLACLHNLAGAGTSPGDAATDLAALLAVYRNHETAETASVHQTCELLVDHDEIIATWRHRHALMAAREIGQREGTGGSLGVRYLMSTLEKRFYPLLWEVRSQL